MLRVQLLGDFKLTVDGTLRATVNVARLQSLLTYLVLHGRTPIARQQLAFTFWPDTPDAPSRNNLRAFRRALNLYSGDLLPTCYDDWITGDREPLRAQCVAALAQAIRDAVGPTIRCVRIGKWKFALFRV